MSTQHNIVPSPKERKSSEGNSQLLNGSDTEAPGAPLVPDIEAARLHLAILAPGEEQFTFQTFDDNKERSKRNKKELGYDPLAKTLHGTLAECWDELVRRNNEGAGIFITFNRTDLRRRREENITHIRGSFQEDDKTFQGTLPLAPSPVVQSSPGKFHRYCLAVSPWEADDDAKHEFRGMMERMIKDFGSDPEAKDLARVLRLAGFYHMKDPTNPQLVRIISSSGIRYSRTELLEKFPPIERSKPRLVIDNTGFATVDNEITGERIYSKRRELEYRSALTFIRTDTRGDWLRRCFALLRLKWDERIAFDMFHDMSKTVPRLYQRR
jgi:RepB DNA-primase from phage plasmid